MSMYKTHELKTWKVHYRAIVNPDKFKRKTVEIRRNDRIFKVGDCLLLREYDPKSLSYTGWQALVVVTHILVDSPWVPPGFVVMSIRHKDENALEWLEGR